MRPIRAELTPRALTDLLDPENVRRGHPVNINTGEVLKHGSLEELCSLLRP